MRLDAELLVKQYYEKVKDQYPDLDFQEFKNICYAPFKFLKQEMSSDQLPVIRFKYFGTFIVYPKRAKYLLKQAEERHRKGTLSHTEFLRIRKMINDFLNEPNNR